MTGVLLLLLAGIMPCDWTFGPATAATGPLVARPGSLGEYRVGPQGEPATVCQCSPCVCRGCLCDLTTRQRLGLAPPTAPVPATLYYLPHHYYQPAPFYGSVGGC